MNLYFAHAFDNRNKLLGWINKFNRNKKGVYLTNPFLISEHPAFKDKSGSIYYNKIKRDAKMIVAKDLGLLKSCDGVVAFIDDVHTIGTFMEVVHAFYYNKPIYIICTNGWDKHPFLVYHATKIFKSIRGFEQWILN